MFESAPKAIVDRDKLWNPTPNWKTSAMLGPILLVALILMLIGAIPSWSHSRNWGYGPSGSLGIVVVLIAMLVLTGRM